MPRKADARESRIEEVFVTKMAMMGYMNIKADLIYRGWADRIFFGPEAHTVIVEFKKLDAPEKRKGEKLQDHFRAQFKARKYPVFKVRGWEEARTVFKIITGVAFDSVNFDVSEEEQSG